MRMKKIISAAILVTLLCVQCLSIVNATPDTEAPTINDVFVKEYDVNHTYTAGEIVQVKIDATDNIQIFYVGVVIRDTVTLQEKEFCFEAYRVEVYDEIIVEIPIEELQTGQYEVIRVTVNDASGNSTQKDLTGEGEYILRVDNPTYGQDVNRPQIKTISVTPTEGDSVTSIFTYTAVIEAGASEITYVGLSLENSSNSYTGFRMTKTDDANTYEVDVNVHNDFSEYIDTIIFDNIYVSVANGDTYNFYPESDWQEEYGFLPIEGVKKGDLDITLTDIEHDTDLPILEKIEYESSVIYTPDEMKIHVTARDNTSNLSGFAVDINEEYYEDGVLHETLYNICGGFFEMGTKMGTIRLDFPRYHDSGKYFVNTIEITDIAGNTATYSIANGDFEKQYFEVKNHNYYDYMTSTSAPDFLGVIRQATAEENKTVVVHIDRANSVVPKEFFEILAGKRTTVIFERVYDFESNGWSTDDALQWIMYGKDINKNKAKDIDVYFYIETACNTTYWDKQLERHNGIDPTEKLEGSDAKIREAMLESGWNDVVKDIEKLQKPNESFVDAYCRICYTPYVRIVFADNGELPGKTTIRFKPAYSMRFWSDEQMMKVFHKNDKNGKFDLVHEKIKKHEEGYYEFDIHHNSEYAFTDEFYDVSISSDNNTIDKAPQTGDGSKITVKKTAIKKIAAKKKTLTIKWKKTSGVTGYEVQVSLNKEFKKGLKTKNIKDAKKTSVTIKKLKAKKKYFVRVRAYKKVNGVKYTSKWCTVKTKKTK